MRAYAALPLVLLSALARAEEAPPPPAALRAPPESVVLPSSKAPEPRPEPSAIKVRIDGEYEARQSFLTDLPLSGGALGQTSRLFHWLRLRGLGMFGTSAVLRAEADVPRGMVYGAPPDRIADSGTDFEQIQPVQAHPRVLRLTLRAAPGELSIGHTTAHLGMGLLDHDGDQPRWFGTPERPATFERISLLSGQPSAPLRVGIDGDLLFDDGRASLVDGDQLYRVSLTARYAPSRAVALSLLTRYQALRPRGDRSGMQRFDFDLSGSVRQRLRGKNAELFAEYEGVYRVGNVDEDAAYAQGSSKAVVALGLATRAGVALERYTEHERYAHFVASVGWGMASGDADPTDDELHRFVMNPGHGVGLILFSEILRFKTARAQADLDATAPGAPARTDGLSTRGGVAGASYLNPVILVRPTPDLKLTAGGVIATATSDVIDPAALARLGDRQNFDGGSARGHNLGSELDLGAELTLRLDPPTLVRLTIEGALAFPGNAFDDAEGKSLGTQAQVTAGLGLTF